MPKIRSEKLNLNNGILVSVCHLRNSYAYKICNSSIYNLSCKVQISVAYIAASSTCFTVSARAVPLVSGSSRERNPVPTPKVPKMTEGKGSHTSACMKQGIAYGLVQMI